MIRNVKILLLKLKNCMDIKIKILLSAIAILFTTGLVLLYLNLNKPNQTIIRYQPTPTQAPIIPTAFNPDPISNWKTYYNEKHEFEIQYPQELNIDTKFENTYLNQTVINLLPDVYDPDRGEGDSIGIVVYKNQRKYSPLEWMRNNPSYSNYSNQSYEDIIINGKKGHKYVAEAMGKITTIVFSHENNIFLLYTYNYEKYLDQILSTFKFVTPSPQSSCGSCPQLMPPAPDFCKGGSVRSEKTDGCGCSLGPECVY